MFLVGDAGIGKSCLLFEFRRGLENQPHLWFEGRCASYGKATAFLPIIDGLRRYFRIDDRDDEAAAVRKIEEGVGDLGGNLAWTLPFVRQLLALPMGDEAAVALGAASRRAQTFGALSYADFRRPNLSSGKDQRTSSGKADRLCYADPKRTSRTLQLSDRGRQRTGLPRRYRN